MYSITDPAYGASTASTPAANKTAIDACIAAAPAYSTILIPTGTFLTTGLHQIRQPGIRLIFEGQLKLADGGVMKNYLLSAANENIVLYTPRLDMDRANNVDQYAGVDGGGTQATLYCYAADNLIVLGGKIEGGIHNNIQGAGRNQQFLGTWLDNNGEHAVYFDGSNLGYKNFRFTNMKITNNAQKTALNRLIGAMKLESISEVYIDNLEYDAGDNNVSPSTTCVLDLLDVQTLRMRGGRARQMNAFGVQSDANCRDIQIDGTTFDWIDRAPANIVNSPSVFRSNHSRYIVSITRSGAIATVTTGETNGHRMIGGDRVTITGAGQPEYNVTNALITVTGVNSFTFPVVGSPVTPATGTIVFSTDKKVYAVGLVSVGGKQNVEGPERWDRCRFFSAGAFTIETDQTFFTSAHSTGGITTPRSVSTSRTASPISWTASSVGRLPPVSTGAAA